MKLTYLRSQVSGQKAVVKDEIDPAFNIDQYNLLFPLPLFFWDSSAKVEDTGIHKLPMGKGSAYHRGRDPKPFSVFSLEDYRNAGPLLVSLNRPGTLNGKPERFFFSDVAVKLVGSNTWMKAQ